MTTAQELAEWALKLTWSDLPKNVQQIVKEHALDGFGDAVGGRSTVVAGAAAATVAAAARIEGFSATVRSRCGSQRTAYHSCESTNGNERQTTSKSIKHKLNPPFQRSGNDVLSSRHRQRVC